MIANWLAATSNGDVMLKVSSDKRIAGKTPGIITNN
jgi:hypothetical protein